MTYHLGELNGHKGVVSSVAFSPDGALCASVSGGDNALRTWEVTTGKNVRTFSGHSNWVRGVAFLPDSARIVTASDDKTLRIWDLKSGTELKKLVGHASLIIANRVEADALGAALHEAKAAIMTRGGEGCLLIEGGQPRPFAAEIVAAVDTTGCGDAYRAGLLYGIANGLDWELTGRLASLLGAIKIAHRGGQNHRFTRDEIRDRCKRDFGTAIW